MNKDDILQALRHVAMGRSNTPQLVEFAEKLEQVFSWCDAAKDAAASGAQLNAMAFNHAALPGAPMNQWVVPPQFAPAGTPDPVQAVKRGPGRPKKAD